MPGWTCLGQPQEWGGEELLLLGTCRFVLMACCTVGLRERPGGGGERGLLLCYFT
jgi:hypothetical protein